MPKPIPYLIPYVLIYRIEQQKTKVKKLIIHLIIANVKVFAL